MADHHRYNGGDNGLISRLAKFLGVEKMLATVMVMVFTLLGVGVFLAITLYFFFTPVG